MFCLIDILCWFHVTMMVSFFSWYSLYILSFTIFLLLSLFLFLSRRRSSLLPPFLSSSGPGWSPTFSVVCDAGGFCAWIPLSGCPFPGLPICVHCCLCYCMGLQSTLSATVRRRHWQATTATTTTTITIIIIIVVSFPFTSPVGTLDPVS